MNIEEKVEQFKRGLLNEVLIQCSVDEQAFFHRIFPEDVPEKDLEGAIRLCERTLKSKRSKP